MSVNGPITSRIIGGTNAAFISLMRLNAWDNEIIWGLQAIQRYRAKPEGLVSPSVSSLCVSALYRAAAAVLCSLSVYSAPAKVFLPLTLETCRSWRKKKWWVKDKVQSQDQTILVFSAVQE